MTTLLMTCQRSLFSMIRKEKIKTIIIIILAIFLLVACIGIVHLLRNRYQNNNITKTVEPTHDNLDGTIRINVNSSVIVKDNTMQNLNFVNHNIDRLLKFKIRCNEKILYRSDFVNPGQEIVKDTISEEGLKKGYNEAVVEVSYYTMNKELIGQTNVKLELNYFQ